MIGAPQRNEEATRRAASRYVPAERIKSKGHPARPQ